MEWMIVNPSSIHEVCGNLGYLDGNGFYIIKETCIESIDGLLNQLSHDGPQLRTRRILGFTQTVHKDFVPLLNAATLTSHKVLPKVIKLLSYLSSPVECLLPNDYCLTEEGSQVAFEVDLLLKSFKSEFADFGLTQCIVDFIKSITCKSEPMSPEEIDVVSDGLLLLRNILHVPHAETQLQNQILWNLFAHSMDKILIHLMTCEQKEVWGITLVQLIALIYKDQHVQNLQKLLNLWLESSMSESSEDNESNTSPKDQNGDGESSDSNLPTSSDQDPDSENGDKLQSKNNKSTAHKVSSSSHDFSSIKIISPTMSNGSNSQTHGKSKSKSKNGKGKSSKEKISDADSGIHSMLSQTVMSDNKSSIEESSGIDFSKEVECTSTSSNEDDTAQTRTVSPPVMIKRNSKSAGNHSKQSSKLRMPSLKGPPPISPLDKHEMKRKKLHKRSKRSRKSMKALLHHNPTEEDISYILREFTVDFLLKGYSSLVSLLQQQLCGTSTVQMDKSHFLWLITYFLKFASQLELDLEHISVVLSYDMISYLTFEGVAMSENLALCKDDLKPHLRRMHLVVTAIREFVQAVEIYSNMPSYSHDDKVHLQQLQNDMGHVEELRNLFLLLIRQFRPGVQSKQYLQDLITANHVLIVLLEKSGKRKLGEVNVLDFIKEFSSPVIMQQYGHLLEDFRKNGEFVNDCVFTMMHHIAGDLGCPEALCQPLVLKTFSNIWEVEFELKDDWADLIEYVIQRFMKVNNDEKQVGSSNRSGTSNISDDNSSWSKDDIENLHWLYPSCAKSNDPIATILDAYKESCSGSGKTRGSIINQLLQQRIITHNQFLQLFSVEKNIEIPAQDNCGDVSSSTGSIDQVNHKTHHLQHPSSMVSIPTVFTGPNMLESCRQTTFSLTTSGMVNSEGISTSANLPSSTSTPLQNEQIDLTTSDITVSELINELISEGQDLRWLQKQILEACFVKLCLEETAQSKGVEENDIFRKRGDGRRCVLEPVPHHYAILGHSIPIVPWTKWQEINLMSPPYMLLFHKLGFHLPADVGKIFPRIPHFWNSEILFSIATKLGPLPALDKLKFDPSRIHDLDSDTLVANSHRYREEDDLYYEQSGAVLNGCHEDDIGCREMSLPCAGVGVGVGNCFLQSHGAYGYGSEAHSVNWINLVHKSMQLFDRHSETVDSTSSAAESEHLDDCASLKALPPTDISEDVTMLSAAGSDTEDERVDDDADDDASVENYKGKGIKIKISDNSDDE